MTKKSYPEFVAQSGQVNTPPGSYDTVKSWIRESFIDRSANILEIGCTTGFIANQINRYTGAKVTGVDLSVAAIRAATNNSRGNSYLAFQQADARTLPYKNESFSHVVIGGHLPWVQHAERQSHVNEAVRVLRPDGFLLTSLYYFSVPPPEEFLETFNSTFNTSLRSDDDYQAWSSLFDLENLLLEYEENYDVLPPDPKRRIDYVASLGEDFQEEWREKVDLLSQNANYVNFFIKAFQKVSLTDSYIQTPRGGIYTWEKK